MTSKSETTSPPETRIFGDTLSCHDFQRKTRKKRKTRGVHKSKENISEGTVDKNYPCPQSFLTSHWTHASHVCRLADTMPAIRGSLQHLLAAWSGGPATLNSLIVSYQFHQPVLTNSLLSNDA